MTSLTERFTAYLDDAKPITDNRPTRGIVGIVAGILTLGVAVVLAYYWRRLVAAPFFPLGLWLMGWGVWQLVSVRRDQRLAATVRRIVERGQRVNAYVVRAHDSLYRPGSHVQPCQVLISFQPEVSGDKDYMLHLAQRWAEQTRDRDWKVRYRRHQLPLTLTDGSEVYCCDLFLHPGMLSSGYLTSMVLPCVAEYGEQAGIELIPYWLLFPYVESPLSQRQWV
jgi:hypothetical protein